MYIKLNFIFLRTVGFHELCMLALNIFVNYQFAMENISSDFQAIFFANSSNAALCNRVYVILQWFYPRKLWQVSFNVFRNKVQTASKGNK